MMKYIDGPDIWYNLQLHFSNNFIPRLEYDDKVWAAAFRRWLKDQGADIEMKLGQRLLRNSFGIAPHYDRLVFEHDRDATMFILRWS
jgi:hypothetical protein